MKNLSFKLISEHFVTICTVALSVQIANMLFAYLFFNSFIIITAILFIVSALSFLILKDFVKDDAKKIGFVIFKISILIFIVSISNDVIMAIAHVFKNPDRMRSFFNLSYFFNFTTIIGYIALLKKDEFKKTLQNMYDNSITSKLGFYSKDEFKEGDIQLCLNKDDNKPVIIPHKDRFLHMLILGPTGSGKTAQIILPMINQDMQNLNAGITVIEPKSDLAVKVYAMAQEYGRKAMYFNPILPDCPYFNPLFGREEDVIENMATTFKMLNPDSPQFFQDMNENLIRNSLKVLKRLYGNKATLIELARLTQNSGGAGRKMVTSFSRLNAETEAIAKENADIAAWFLNEYFNEKSKVYEHCSGLRSQVAKITSNKYLRRVLNPPDGLNDINFDKHLAEGGVIAVATAQGTLRDLGKFLGYFIILQFQSSVFKRKGNEDSRKAHYLYIDEFQEFSNPGFSIMLTQGRTYRVASHLATQNRALMAMGGGRDGKNFVELVSTNARNIVVFPGGNAQDAKYYSEQFGEIMRTTIKKGISHQKFNPLYGLNKMSYPNESKNIVDALESRFNTTDIIYRPFGEIIYCVMKNNTIQTPGVGKIEFIPIELNKKLDEMITQYDETIFLKDDDDPQDGVSIDNVEVPNVIKQPVIKINNTSVVDPLSIINNPSKSNFVFASARKNVESNDEDEDDLDNPDFGLGVGNRGEGIKNPSDKYDDGKPNKIPAEFNFMNEDEDDII